MIKWLQQNLRINETIFSRFEKYRKSQIINGREMKKNEAFNALLDEALCRQELLNHEIASKPDMGLIRDQINFGDDLHEDEIKYIFSFLDQLTAHSGIHGEIPISINLVKALFDVALIQANSNHIDDLSYMISNSPFRRNNNDIGTTSELLQRQIKYFINKKESLFLISDIEMELRNPFICIRDFPISNKEAVNEYIKRNRKVFLYNLTFYSFLLEPKKSLLKRNISLIKIAEKALLEEDLGNFWLTGRVANLGDIDLSGFLHIEKVTFSVNSYIAFQLMKLSFMGFKARCEKINYPGFSPFYEKEDGYLSSGICSIHIDEPRKQKILELISNTEENNVEIFNVLKDSYGEII